MYSSHSLYCILNLFSPWKLLYTNCSSFNTVDLLYCAFLQNTSKNIIKLVMCMFVWKSWNSSMQEVAFCTAARYNTVETFKVLLYFHKIHHFTVQYSTVILIISLKTSINIISVLPERTRVNPINCTKYSTVCTYIIEYVHI